MTVHWVKNKWFIDSKMHLLFILDDCVCVIHYGIIFCFDVASKFHYVSKCKKHAVYYSISSVKLKWNKIIKSNQARTVRLILDVNVYYQLITHLLLILNSRQLPHDFFSASSCQMCMCVSDNHYCDFSVTWLCLHFYLIGFPLLPNWFSWWIVE